MDVGFARAGFETLVTSELDKDACETLSNNLSLIGHRGNKVSPTSVADFATNFQGKVPEHLDLVFGGPPCQGFSVAGKMNPDDDRSKLIHTFFDVVDFSRPKGFVCENVKALAVSDRWTSVRSELIERGRRDYRVALVVLNSKDFGVPQSRERMFLVGVRKDIFQRSDDDLRKALVNALEVRKLNPPSVADIIRSLGPTGTAANPLTCTAKIVYAKEPILRKSPYAGMLFNGAGRPLPVQKWSTTLPASMGGNKTPIVDDEEIFGGASNFIEEYHAELMNGRSPRVGEAPKRLRRLTLAECAMIQTFPKEYNFAGSKSSIYRQIGNAVPCNLAEAIASSFRVALSQAQGTVSQASRPAA